MPVWAVKFAAVRLCRSIICGLFTIRTLMVWPSVAGFLVGPPAVAAPPPAAAEPPAAADDAPPPAAAEALVAAPPPAAAEVEELLALLEAELPHAASRSSAAQPTATATLGFRYIVILPIDGWT